MKNRKIFLSTHIHSTQTQVGLQSVFNSHTSFIQCMNAYVRCVYFNRIESHLNARFSFCVIQSETKTVYFINAHNSSVYASHRTQRCIFTHNILDSAVCRCQKQQSHSPKTILSFKTYQKRHHNTHFKHEQYAYMYTRMLCTVETCRTTFGILCGAATKSHVHGMQMGNSMIQLRGLTATHTIRISIQRVYVCVCGF